MPAFKPTPPLLRARRRLQLTTKQAGKDFYRGNRTGSMGRHTMYGGYVIEWRKVRTYKVPAYLADFHLTPFVSAAVERVKGTFGGYEKGAMDGRWFLDRWKGKGGDPVVVRERERESGGGEGGG